MKNKILYGFSFVILAISSSLTAQITRAEVHSAIEQLKEAPEPSRQRDIVDLYLSHARVASTAATLENVSVDN